jgi:hypothetical protein
MEPAQEILCGVLVLAVAHDHVGKRHMPAELADGPLGQRGVEDVVPERHAVLGLICVGLLLCFDIDRGAVIGGADRAGKKGAIVAGIVPRKPAVIASVLPEADRELDRLDGFLAVQHDRLSVGFNLLAAP